MMPRRLLAPLLLCAALLPLAAAGDGPSVSASRIWVREAPPGVTVLAGYFVLQNLTGKPLTLTSASSREFGMVEMHRSVSRNGVESMEPVASADIPAGGSIDFKPGGYHLMLMQPKKNLFAGDLVTLTLNFSDGSILTLLAPVRRDPPN